MMGRDVGLRDGGSHDRLVAMVGSDEVWQWWFAWEVRSNSESQCWRSQWSVAKEARDLATMGHSGGAWEAG